MPAPLTPLCARPLFMYVFAFECAEPESPLMKTIIGGGVTLVMEVAGGHPLEMLKIRKQTSHTFSYMQLTKQMTANKGLVGLLDGFLPWCVPVCRFV